MDKRWTTPLVAAGGVAVLLSFAYLTRPAPNGEAGQPAPSVTASTPAADASTRPSPSTFSPRPYATATPQSYLIVNTTPDQDRETVTEDARARVRLVETYLTGLEGRDYGTAYPGFDVERTKKHASGSAAALVDSKRPDPDAYAAAPDYTRTVKVIDAYVNDQDNSVIMNLNTADSHSVTTEVSYRVELTACEVGTCITKAEQFTTE